MYINLLITMILGGLWHGANIRFLIWGAIHGVGLVLEKFIRRIFSLQTKPKKWKRLLSVFVTFQVVSIAWIFFRARDYSIVQQLFYQIRHHFMPRDLVGGWESYHWVIFVFIIGLVTIWFPDPLKERMRGKFIRLPSWIQIPVILTALFLITLVAHSTLQPFIYFRF